MPAGRPTKYDPSYCEKLIKHMAQGLSYLSFAGVIEVNPDTMYEWEKKHPEFSEAKKIAFQKGRLAWETMGIAGTVGKTDKFSAAAWIFNMKNRFKWTDRQEIQVEEAPDEKDKKLDLLLRKLEMVQASEDE